MINRSLVIAVLERITSRSAGGRELTELILCTVSLYTTFHIILFYTATRYPAASNGGMVQFRSHVRSRTIAVTAIFERTTSSDVTLMYVFDV